MTNYIGWTPPPGVGVVAPPVHPETRVDVIYSDGDMTDTGGRAGSINWSAIGDGPSVVAYAIVEEYKPAPREWWIYRHSDSCHGIIHAPNDTGFLKSGFIHVREVLPEAREVVAWAVVGDDGKVRNTWLAEGAARLNQSHRGGTVVRLSGVMPS